MKIYFNSIGQEINRVTNDIWVQGDNDTKYLQAYFEDVNLLNYNIVAVALRNGDDTSSPEILMSNINNEYVQLKMNEWFFEKAGLIFFSIKLKKPIGNNEYEVQVTGLFSREIQVGNIPSDTTITPPEAEAIHDAINNLDNKIDIETENRIEAIESEAQIRQDEDTNLNIRIDNIENGNTKITADKAIKDGDGNNIVNTYARKTALENTDQIAKRSFQDGAVNYNTENGDLVLTFFDYNNNTYKYTTNIPLNMILENVYYDAEREEIVIEFTTNTIRIPLSAFAIYQGYESDYAISEVDGNVIKIIKVKKADQAIDLVDTSLITEGVFLERITAGVENEIKDGSASIIQIGGMTIKQLISNGDFSNGISSWIAYQSTIAVSEGRLVQTIAAPSAINRIVQSVYLKARQTYIIRWLVTPKYNSTTFIRMYNNTTYVSSVNVNILANIENECIVTLTPTFDITAINIYLPTNIPNYVEGDNIFYGGIGVFNLNEIPFEDVKPIIRGKYHERLGFSLPNYFVSTGTNLFNQESILIENGFVKQSDNSFVTDNPQNISYKVIFDNKMGYSGEFNIYLEIQYETAISLGAYPQAVYIDGTVSNLSPEISANKQTLNFSTLPNKTVSKIIWFYESEVKTIVYNMAIYAKTDITEFISYTNKTINLNISDKRVAYSLLNGKRNYINIATEKLIGKVKIQNLGDLTWTKDAITIPDNPYFYSEELPDMIITNTVDYNDNSILSDRYLYVGVMYIGDNTFSDKTIIKGISSKSFFIRDLSYDDATTLKNDLQGVFALYETAEVFEEDYPINFDNIYNAYNWGMEYFDDTAYLSSQYSYDKIQQIDTNRLNIQTLFNTDLQLEQKINDLIEEINVMKNPDLVSTIDFVVESEITPIINLKGIGSDANIQIDWGDGDISTLVLMGEEKITITKPNAYSTGYYIIKLICPRNEYYGVVGYDIEQSMFGIHSGSVRDVKFADNVLEIGNYAFYGCLSLTMTKYSENISTIGEYAFYGCSNLEIPHLPTELLNLGIGAFAYCNLLNIKTLSSKIMTVPTDCFLNCTSLIQLIVTNNVITINSRAFSGCSNLTFIYIPNTVITISASSVSNSPVNGANINLVINCQVSEQPGGWGAYWNYISTVNQAHVNWNATR